ncbi:MAG: hypothetical protein PHV95_10590 [Eubacteriales bacterium]|nr:hypothetical protein [Eubacteriales bacterium]
MAAEIICFVLTAAAAQDHYCNQYNYPATVVIRTKERIKASHNSSSFLLS